MTAASYNASPKYVYFRAFPHFSHLEEALKHIKEEDLAQFQISILGKVPQFFLDNNLEISQGTDPLNAYWKNTSYDSAIAKLNNPQYGNIFIVGPLAATFLFKVDGKALGTLSAGPNGILRGIGASEAQVKTNLDLLHLGNYLLVLRGEEKDLEKYKMLVEEG